MPRLMGSKDDMSTGGQSINIPGPGNFQFSAVRIEDLGATEYTLVTIVCDISGSVEPFSASLLDCIKSIIGACQKSPRAENLLVRLILFNNNIQEVHGFKELSIINPDDYEELHPDGMTALFDAAYDAVGATLEYARRLIDQDFDCNGAVYIITDGMNNRGTMTPTEIRNKIKRATGTEEIESLITILVGLHDPNLSWEQEIRTSLDEFKNNAELTQFVDAGEATPKRLAKLANFVSESISSQSNALGTGAPSQSLTF